ncbi:MAG: cellobiose phosphorylase [Oscillibacter sp.]|nr:cellobiose phosphorylase [Oscillibacter sp.]
MQQLQYLNERGDFVLRGAQDHGGIYFPLANEGGMMSSVTPLLAGDCKTGQNTFLLAPASAETLHESRASRNFWVRIDGGEPWSAAGQSAPQQALRFTEEAEEAVLTGGLLWQNVRREHRASGLRADILSFVPAGGEKVEIMQVTLTNGGTAPLEAAPAAAVPLYARSADNIRDHRHVTSLLHRVELRRHGLDVTPTLTFDERGHQPGRVTYRVWGGDETGAPPTGFIPLVRDFVGRGSYDWPEAVVRPCPANRLRAGESAEGGEVIAALFFPAVTLLPGERRRYQIILAVDDSPAPYLTPDAVEAALEETKRWWQARAAQTVHTGDPRFDAWMRWVAVQPVLRRIFGCGFLPHHDYGRGGRGWRDLWQDSLALLLSRPAGVRGDLLAYFAGVRTDGTNATIIGARPGEFKADRNNIPRVWMDHGFWPLLTTALYLDETGDAAFLLEKQSYFADALPWRGEWKREAPPDGLRTGTVLEHILVQMVTAFYDVGEHGHMRLRGADWNDGLDMAARRGESVAFTAAYAYGLELLAGAVRRLGAEGHAPLALSAPLAALLDFPAEDWGVPEKMRRGLLDYCAGADRAWESASCAADELAGRLLAMAGWIRDHIARTEWVGDGADLHWFNSYYDNSGRQVEGLRGETVRMMLTGQVFCILSGAASGKQVQEIIRAADWYLCHPARGGYCLNTDFGEVKLDMGRMFGFAYGSKENGAVFSHMAVMYAYALYARGYAAEGWRVLEHLFRQSGDFARGRILPGIPEYFDLQGQGMYPYLTGAASWMLLTLQTQAFGVRGRGGDLVLEPRLTAEQFDSEGVAEICCTAAGKRLLVRYRNPEKLDWGEYRLGEVSSANRRWTARDGAVTIRREELPETEGVLELTAALLPREGGEKNV